MCSYKMKPDKTETIAAVRQDTKWASKVKLRIAGSREEAIAKDKQNQTAIKIYTDSSGHEGRIGMAAVLYRQGQEKAHLWYQLGRKEKHTVYKAECVGVMLAIKLAAGEWGAQVISIDTDNQAAIKAITTT